jgi:hypothetical protein
MEPNPAKSQSHLKVILLALVLATILVGAFYYFIYGSLNKPLEAKVTYGKDIPYKDFPSDGIRLFDTKVLVATSTSIEGSDSDFYLYKIGSFTSGPYKGGDLLLLENNYDVCYKRMFYSNCIGTYYARYAKINQTLYLLEKISDPEFVRTSTTTNSILIKALSLGDINTISNDSTADIPSLGYIKEIEVNTQSTTTIKIPYFGESESQDMFYQIPLTSYTTLGRHPIFGDIKCLLSRDGVGGRSTPCILVRPDETALVFNYDFKFGESFSTNKITSDQKLTANRHYSPRGDRGYSEFYMAIEEAYPTIVKDMILIGKTGSTSVDVYTITSTSSAHQNIYKGFTDSYNKYDNPTRYDEDGKMYEPNLLSKLLSIEEFIRSTPIILVKNDFGVPVVYIKEEYSAANFAEPMIYLYPEKEQKTIVKLGDIIKVTESYPLYNKGWDVIASPNGMLKDLINGGTYDKLFWEGVSHRFLLDERGDVVAREDIESYFNTTLQKLGLNEKEKNDFIKAWLPRFSKYPYYLFNFINQKKIDELAPLHISPKPDTVIRILMDYRGLSKKESYPTQELPTPPERKGFTVIEWGGMLR